MKGKRNEGQGWYGGSESVVEDKCKYGVSLMKGNGRWNEG